MDRDANRALIAGTRSWVRRATIKPKARLEQ
jgi:hypothetical protein